MNSTNKDPIIQEVTVNAPVSEVWKAITEKDEMKKWYFDLDAFKAEPGFNFQFTGTGRDGTSYLHLCRVIEVIKEKRISYSWQYEVYPGESVVTFELFNEGEQTRVLLTHKGVESFANDNPDFAKESFVAGWKEIIGTSLKEFVEKRLTSNKS